MVVVVFFLPAKNFGEAASVDERRFGEFAD